MCWRNKHPEKHHSCFFSIYIFCSSCMWLVNYMMCSGVCVRTVQEGEGLQPPHVAIETTYLIGEKMSDGRKRSKIECRECQVKLSYGADSINNMHRHMRTVHPSVQSEEKTPPQPQPQPPPPAALSDSLCKMICTSKCIFCSTVFHEYNKPYKW